MTVRASVALEEFSKGHGAPDRDSEPRPKNAINWRKTETGRGGVEVLKHSPCHWLPGVSMQMKERHFRSSWDAIFAIFSRAVAGRRTGGEQCRQLAEEPVWCRLRFLRQAVTGGECVAGGWAREVVE